MTDQAAQQQTETEIPAGPSVRTVEQIRARYEEEKANDPLGMAITDLMVYLPEHIKEGSEADRPPSRAQMEDEIKKYLPFAFGKAIDHRGLSANRSCAHLRNWAWLGGMDDLVKQIDETEYPNYGVPILKKVAAYVGVALPDDIAAWKDGEPCEPGCTMGCGR